MPRAQDAQERLSPFGKAYQVRCDCVRYPVGNKLPTLRVFPLMYLPFGRWVVVPLALFYADP